MSSRFFRNVLLTLGIIAVTLPAFFCNSPKSNDSDNTLATANTPTSRWRNVYDTSVHYVGMKTCRICHESVYETFHKTGMGQSFDHATREKSAADFSPQHALVYDKNLDYYYKPYWQNDTFYVMEFRLKGKDTVHKRIQRVDYIVGSGQHTNSHMYDINGYFYQVPITFYTQKHKWDLAPGFENGKSSRFHRMIEIECMSCHNGYPDFVNNSQNKFVNVKTGIDCERCHGPGSLHVKEKEAGDIIDTSKGPDYSIVNPRRLPTDLQTNVCERCHLQGITVLNDGKTFFDFRPGMHLSEVMNVFMPEYEGARDKMIMASHVERMKKSQCYIQSGKMSCITCHNPHVSVKYTPKAHFISVCESCHGDQQGQQQCTEKLAVRNLKSNDCITCHMPHNGSIDIPHVAVTDHFIRKHPMDYGEKSKITAFLGVECINNKHIDDITQARGYMEFYERYASDSKPLLDSAKVYLDKRSKDEATDEQNRDYIRLDYLLNNFSQVIQYAEQLKPETINDAWTAYRIGEAYFQSQQADKALNWYHRAIQIWPYSLDFENKYGTCLLALHKVPEAQKVFQFIIDQNPNYTSANTNLGYVYMLEGNNTMAYDYLSKANDLDPDHEQNLINLAVWYHNNQMPGKAKKCLEHLLEKYPNNQRAKAMLMDLH